MEEQQLQSAAFGGQQHMEHVSWFGEGEGEGEQRPLQQCEEYGGTMMGVGERGGTEGEWREMIGEMGADSMTEREVEGMGMMREEVAHVIAKTVGEEVEGHEMDLPSSPVLMFGDVQYDDTSPMSAALMKPASPQP